MSHNVFIVEDHPLMRRMLSEFVEKMGDVEVCTTVATGEEAIERLHETHPDLVLIDVSLPGISGIELITRLHAQRPELPCLILSGHQEIIYVQRALAAGARGYVAKGKPREIVEAIRQVIAGEIYLSPQMQSLLDDQNRS
jgi:DNA-binding NarL/FixJ family response regulator